MINEKACENNKIEVYDVVERRLDYLKDTYGVQTATDIKAAAAESEMIFIAVRPQDAQGVLEAIRDNKKKEGLIISICAGITIENRQRF